MLFFVSRKIYTIYKMTDLNELLKHTSRSLYLSARLLPTDVRDGFCVAYLLCRYADSIADTSLLPPPQRAAWIKDFPSFLTHPQDKKWQQLPQTISSSATNIYEEQLLRNLPACLQAYAQLPAWQQPLILQVVRAVCSGMEIDLNTFPDENSGTVRAFGTAGELENYCHLMGGEPGVFWSQLIAHTVALPLKQEKFLALGKQIGDTLQIVNILRDLPRDLRIGRCYFPQEELQSYGLQPADLLDEKNSTRFEQIKQKWISWARQNLQAAYAYLRALPKSQLAHRAAVAWPVLWAADTLKKLAQESNLLDPQVRVKIPRSRIYLTMLATPLIWASNTLFEKWLFCKLSDGK